MLNRNSQEIAKYDPKTGRLSIRVNDQWVDLDEIIESLVTLRTVLKFALGVAPTPKKEP